jgi:hypothetical protein
MTDAFRKAEPFIPVDLVLQALRLNLELLGTHRDNAVHFYNASHFGTVIYALMQTRILNLRDMIRDEFEMDLRDDMTWQLLPLGLDTPIDPIDYISGRKTIRTGPLRATCRQKVK